MSNTRVVCIVLCNEENKRRLCRFFLEKWKKGKYAPKLQGKHLVSVQERKCISLKSIDGKNVVTGKVEKFCSSHEEADTRIILHCNDVAASSPESSVIQVRSPDTCLRADVSYFLCCTRKRDVCVTPS